MCVLGAGAVGMSTVPEALAATQCGMKVLGLATITNVANPDVPQATGAEQRFEEVLNLSRTVQVKSPVDISGGTGPPL